MSSTWNDEIPELYDVARECCHDVGLPWTDPRTGVTYPPPRRRREAQHRRSRSARFTFTHPKQRDVWLSYVETIERASAVLRAELLSEQPDVAVLDRLYDAIVRDLDELRRAYVAQRASQLPAEP